jgi:peptidoglycan/xylan/chitin deacetylase (PgdA/CDA1 family)
MAAPAFTVLAYHRIARPNPDDELASTLIDAYPEAFEAQMRHIASRWSVVSAWEVVDALREGKPLPRRALLITFDDGYKCFLTQAMPVLRRLNLPLTLFVPTGFPGEESKLFWWDELHRAIVLTPKPPAEALRLAGLEEKECATGEAFARLVEKLERTPEVEAERLLRRIVEWSGVEPNKVPHMLTWEEIASLEGEGVAIGPHTRNHILSRGSEERIAEEVAGSWADLRRHVARPLPLFCYPNGKPHAIDRRVVSAVHRTGLAGAFTMVAGMNRIGHTDPYLLYRVGAVAGESLARFRFKIGAGGRLYRGLKRAVKVRVD